MALTKSSTADQRFNKKRSIVTLVTDVIFLDCVSNLSFQLYSSILPYAAKLYKWLRKECPYNLPYTSDSNVPYPHGSMLAIVFAVLLLVAFNGAAAAAFDPYPWCKDIASPSLCRSFLMSGLCGKKERKHDMLTFCQKTCNLCVYF
ncbi:hypothetical protein Q1695_003061 [Nippostrongylus brasiliensis]|nr:hypothetical protein Q1695_003061 [Nippostrongylus brasiliensis]